MKLTHVLSLTLVAAATLVFHEANAQDARTVVLRFRKEGDTTVVLRHAEVRIDHTIDLVTDSAGIVRVPELEDGGHIVEVVAKGYQGYFDNFVSGANVPSPIEFEIREFIAPPKPKGAPTGLLVADFAKRRTMGNGRFFTLAQLSAADGRPLANFLKIDAAAYIASGPQNESFLASRPPSPAAAPCYAAVVRDGLRIYPLDNSSPPDLDKIFTDDLASIELYSGTAPAALGVVSKCGVLVLWSRHP